MALVWIVRDLGSPKLPYRISVEDSGGVRLAVRAAEKWPTSGGNIFCIRDDSAPDETSWLPEIERVPVVSFERFGRKVTIILDRSVRKRCEFLFIEKKGQTGSYEQIFFRTQRSVETHKSKSKALLSGETSFSVAIDASERYPWKFPKCCVSRRKLAAGDYALVDGEKILAAVERKTFDNLLSDFARINPLHQTLTELEKMRHAAVVIEAQYGDFTDPKRLDGRWPVARCFKLLAELQAMHPDLPIIFAGTRKDANKWTWAFFRAVSIRTSREKDNTPVPGSDEAREKRLEYLDKCSENSDFVLDTEQMEAVTVPGRGKTPADTQETVPEPSVTVPGRTKTPADTQETVPRRGKAPADTRETVPGRGKTPADTQETVPEPSVTVPRHSIPEPEKLETRIMKLLSGKPEGLTVNDISSKLWNADEYIVLKSLESLRRLCLVKCEGRGRKARWRAESEGDE